MRQLRLKNKKKQREQFSISGGTVKPGITNLPIELETGLLYIKHIPADICEQCDDIFIPDNVAAKIEEIVDAAKKQKVEIEVVDFQGAA
ncbi:MAG: type II toxin-antitoxin system MqsA family antitoxin [Rubrobacteridae bacterium]|nr:type II toxin-antitoxin system MqsA family antitoxin [Rubrobacteridae bacterium]